MDLYPGAQQGCQQVRFQSSRNPRMRDGGALGDDVFKLAEAMILWTLPYRRAQRTTEAIQVWRTLELSVAGMAQGLFAKPRS